VSSFLTAREHILGYLLPDLIKEWI